MNFFPEKLYEILTERAGSAVHAESKTKRLLEKGGAEIIKNMIAETGQLAGAAMEQDIDRIIAEVADVWYYTLVTMLYYGVTPEQVERYLIERDRQSQ